jgi:hypothetical protein
MSEKKNPGENTTGVSIPFSEFASLFGFLQNLLELGAVHYGGPRENGEENADRDRQHAQDYRGDPEAPRPLPQSDYTEDQTGQSEDEVQNPEQRTQKSEDAEYERGDPPPAPSPGIFLPHSAVSRVRSTALEAAVRAFAIHVSI